MRFSKLFDLETESIEITIDYFPEGEAKEQYISGEISVEPGSGETGKQLHIHGKNGIIVSPSIIPLSENQSTEIQLYVPAGVSILEFDIEIANNNVGTTVVFADRTLLRLGYQILQKEAFVKSEFRTKLSSLLDHDREYWRLYNFTKDIGQLIDFDTYLTLLGRLVDEFPVFRTDLEDILNVALTDLLLGRLADGKFQIKKFTQYEETIERLSNVHDEASPDPESSIRHALKKLDNEEDLSGVFNLVKNLKVVDIYPNTLSDRIFFLIISEEIQRKGESNVRNIVECYFETKNENAEFEEERYESLKKEAQSADDSKEYAKNWYKTAKYAKSNPSSREFKFLISSLLYSAASHYESQSDYYYIIPNLYQASSIWFKHVNHDLYRRAEFEKYYRRGLNLYHDHNHEESSYELSEAIKIAANPDGRYDSPKPDWLFYPIIYKSLADARQLTGKGDREDAAELLQDRINGIKKFDTISDEVIEQILAALRSEKFRIVSDIHLKQGEYERASEKMGQAIGLFTEAGLKRASRSAVEKKKEIDAVIKEVNGEFGIAADFHQSISENDNFSSHKKNIHAIRGIICTAKAEALQGNYENSKNKIRELSGKRTNLRHEEVDLAILVDLLLAFDSHEVMNIRRALEKTSTMKQRSEYDHPLEVKYDYTEPIVVVLSLQRLRRSQLPDDLLEAIIDVSLNRSFTPTHSIDASEDRHLGDISIDRLWRERLPSPVLSRVEQIQLEKAIAIGNHKSVTLLLAELLEFYLALLVEYYAQRHWGDDWRSHLAKADEDSENLSIGILSRIFSSEASVDINNSESMEEIYFSQIGKFHNLTQMRNNFDHGYEGFVEESTFERLHDRIFEFLRESVKDVPLIASVQDNSRMGMYYMRLHWWRGIRHVLIETEAELDIGDYYYLPANEITDSAEQEIYTIKEEDIFEVEDGRVKDQIDEIDRQ